MAELTSKPSIDMIAALVPTGRRSCRTQHISPYETAIESDGPIWLARTKEELKEAERILTVLYTRRIHKNLFIYDGIVCRVR